MITVLSLTQFAFIALGVAALKILVHAQTGAEIAPAWMWVNSYSPWLLLVPVLWTGFAFACLAINRGPLNAAVARITGVILAVGSFFFLVSAVYFSEAG